MNMDEFEKLLINDSLKGLKDKNRSYLYSRNLFDKYRELKPKLKAQILKQNPLAGLSDEEKEYALYCILSVAKHSGAKHLNDLADKISNLRQLSKEKEAKQ